MILGLACVLFCENEKRAGINKMDYHYVPNKILTWMLREAKGGLKATVGNRVNQIITLSV